MEKNWNPFLTNFQKMSFQKHWKNSFPTNHDQKFEGSELFNLDAMPFQNGEKKELEQMTCWSKFVPVYQTYSCTYYYLQINALIFMNGQLPYYHCIRCRNFLHFHLHYFPVHSWSCLKVPLRTPWWQEKSKTNFRLWILIQRESKLKVETDFFLDDDCDSGNVCWQSVLITYIP